MARALPNYTWPIKLFLGESNLTLRKCDKVLLLHCCKGITVLNREHENTFTALIYIYIYLYVHRMNVEINPCKQGIHVKTLPKSYFVQIERIIIAQITNFLIWLCKYILDLLKKKKRIIKNIFNPFQKIYFNMYVKWN